jgi:Tat protein translocase TatB subunit
MFGIGGTELVIIAVVLLIAVGPNKLPKLLKAVVSGYREFRRATRELRASTGIDEILQDEDLRDLRKPLYVPPPKAKPPGQTVPTKPRRRSLSYDERVQEDPPEGVDLAEIHEAAQRPGPEEAARIRAAKEAKAAEAERVRAAKIAAAQPSPDEAERVRAQKRAAAEAPAEAELAAVGGARGEE